jgi:hypothetical protein
MNPRATALLALVVAALGAFVWLYEIRGADERAERSEAEKRVFRSVEADDVSEVTLRPKDGAEIRLEKAESGWRITAPISFPADAGTAESVASALAGLRSEAVIDDPGPLAEYGLEGEPRVRFRADGEEHVLRIGGRSPLGANTYVATAADRPILVVASYRTASLERSLDDLREKRLARFERDAVVEARVRWKGGAVRLVRDEEDTEAWRLVEPLEAPADGRTVSKLLSDLEFLRATGFVDAPPADVVKRLEAPELAVELRTKADGKEGTVAVALGAPDGENAPARGQVEGAVYQIPAGRLGDFPRSVDAYRDKTLARFAPSEARRFELAFHGEGAGESLAVTGTREGEAWKTAPEALDPEKVEALLRELSGLDGASVAAESMGPAERAELGLEPPRAVLRVFGGAAEDADALLAEVQLGTLDPKRGIPARRPDRETVYYVAAERAEQLPVSLEALRAGFVAKAPEPAAEGAPGAAAGEPGAAASPPAPGAAPPGAERAPEPAPPH